MSRKLYATCRTAKTTWSVYDDDGLAYITRTRAGRTKSWHAVGPHRSAAAWVAIQRGKWELANA